MTGEESLGVLALIGNLRNQVIDLMSEIAAQRERVEELKAELHNLKSDAARLA